MRKRTTAAAARQVEMVPTQRDWTAGANPEQAEVIMHDAGPCRVLACAGAGKTYAICHRVARLVADGADPRRILVMTFTRKAADEMSARIVALGVSGVRVGTFHSFCSQVMKTDQTEWARWETRESTKMELKDVVGFRGMKWNGADVNLLASFIGMCKAFLVSPEDDEADVHARRFGLPSQLARRAYSLYQDRLSEKRILSYDDYIVNVARHLDEPENQAAWSARYDHVITDEDQDTNHAQKKIRNALARDHRNVMVVGDVFQSIYAWRGSDPLMLAGFDKEWPGAKTITLGANYRSGSSIIAAANGIVGRAVVGGVSPIEMRGARELEGSVELRVASTFDDEGNGFALWCKFAVEAGDRRYQDHCALFRTNAQSRALEEALIKHRIPYVIVGGTQFYDRKEVRDLLGYLRVASDRGDLEDIKRCINAPFRFLGLMFVQRVMDAAGDERDRTATAWGDLVRRAATGEGIQGRQRASAEEWARIVERVRAQAAAGAREGASEDEVRAARPSEMLEEIIRRTGYIEWIQKEEGEESIETSGAANVREMCRVAERFPNVGALLDYVDETSRAAARQREDKQAGGDRVLLMNVFKAKGLEWPRVWIAGFNEMLMPHPRGEPEEERRVAYVAATRARDEMVFSCVKSMATRAGIKDAAPSRFLADAGVRVADPMPRAKILRSGSYDLDDGDIEALDIEAGQS